MKRWDFSWFLRRALLVFVFAGQISASGCVFAAGSKVVPTDEGGSSPRQALYARGRLLVKLTPAAAQQIAHARGRLQRFDSEQLPIESLRALSQKYQVKSWQSLFPQTKAEDPAGLGRIYLLSCDPQVDVQAAADAFSQLPDIVEYAEPDTLVEVQNRRVTP